jgi:FKBP-type peptidyl-prolyl cis-trans isomerase
MGNGKDYARRFGSLFMAGLFLITTIAFTALIMWQTKNDSDKASEQETIQAALDEANNSESPEETGEEGMLKGTPLSGFTPIADPAATLQTVDLTEGNGETVAEGATITAHYTGAYAVNGEIFESSLDSGTPATFPLSGVIAGWQQGVPGMKVGGKRRLIIPGNLAYGEAPAGYVPGSTDRPLGTLVFDIELVSIGQ